VDDQAGGEPQYGAFVNEFAEHAEDGWMSTSTPGMTGLRDWRCWVSRFKDPSLKAGQLGELAGGCEAVIVRGSS
jgi:hypothetical protein